MFNKVYNKIKLEVEKYFSTSNHWFYVGMVLICYFNIWMLDKIFKKK